MSFFDAADEATPGDRDCVVDFCIKSVGSDVAYAEWKILDSAVNLIEVLYCELIQSSIFYDVIGNDCFSRLYSRVLLATLTTVMKNVPQSSH